MMVLIAKYLKVSILTNTCPVAGFIVRDLAAQPVIRVLIVRSGYGKRAKLADGRMNEKIKTHYGVRKSS